MNGNPALRALSLPIKEITPEIRELSERMIVSMKENEIVGVGLAAPQVGIDIRLIVIDTRPCGKTEKAMTLSAGEALLNPLMPLALVNPEILSYSAEKVSYNEGCLSLPGIDADIVRPSSVLLRAKDINGNEICTNCGGLLARCLQHEIDHLNGILFIDLADEAQREAAAPRLHLLEIRERKLLAGSKKRH